MAEPKRTRTYEWNDVQVENVDAETLNRVRVRRTYYLTNPNRNKIIESMRNLNIGEGLRVHPIVDGRHVDRLRALTYGVGKRHNHRYTTYQIYEDDGTLSLIVERLPDKANVVAEQWPL